MKPETIVHDIKTLLDLVRVRNCLIASVAVLLGASLVYSGGEILPLNSLVLAAMASVFLIVGGGNALNDYFDCDIDKVNKPHRPIPSCRVAKSDAFMVAVAMLFIGLGISKQINNHALGIASLNTLVLVVYAKYSKRMLLISNLVISYLVASTFIYGAAVILFSPPVSGNIEIADFALVAILSTCAFFLTFARELIKDIEDVEGDKREYSLTLPIKIGIKKSLHVAIILTMIGIFAGLVPLHLYTEMINVYVYAIFILIADLIFLAALTMHPSFGQRMMILGMVVSLIAFFMSTAIP